MTISFDDSSGRKLSNLDQDTEQRIADHCEKYEIGSLDAVNHFPILARRQHLKRFLAHTELFQKTITVPGDIAELGVYRGLGLMTWANLLEAYCIGNRTKMVFGFDNWTGFSEIAPEDGNAIENVGKEVGGFNPGKFKEELKDAIEIYDGDRFIPNKPRIRLIDGDIEKSVPTFVDENPGVRFSLIHFDCDLYAPTKAALEFLWPQLNRGGVIMFDEFGIHDWPGETAAVEEFFSDIPNFQLQTLSWTNQPAAWAIKQ